MDAIALVALIASMYLAGQLAVGRGRSLKNWVGIAAFVGPLALPLIFVFPNLNRKNSAA